MLARIRLLSLATIVPVALAVAPAAARAAALPPLYGAGANSCRTLLDLQKDGRGAPENNWITGYVTALVDNLPGLRAHADVILSQRASAWFVRYCTVHPETRIGDAVRIFDLELRKGFPEPGGAPQLFGNAH